MRFTITKPSVWMYSTDDLCGEVSDELLFGTGIEIISENDTCAYCRTDYGYYGFLNKWEMCRCVSEDCNEGEKQLIYNRCDLLTEPQYRLAPSMSLPKGSRVLVTRKYDERFSVCLVGKRQYYLPNRSLERKQYHSFDCSFVETALSYVGAPYRWGGKSDMGIDCSGLVFMAARLCGKSVYRDAVPDERYVNIINGDDLKKGDLIYFKGHVALYSGDDRIIHSSARLGGVVSQELSQFCSDKKEILCYARIK